MPDEVVALLGGMAISGLLCLAVLIRATRPRPLSAKGGR